MAIHHKGCPKCGAEWHDKKGAGVNIIGIQYGYPSKECYDGVSEWNCQKCGYREGRWSGKEIHEGELESRLGERGVVKIENAKEFNDMLSM
jgi:ribosomal protein S27AE